MDKIIFGRNGWLANYYANYYGIEVNNADVFDDMSIFFDTPKIVINCVGRTGRPNVDWCDLNEENRLSTYRANVSAVAVLQSWCDKSGSKLVHLSSGCLWAGGTDIKEDETPDPNSYYACTKVEGEQQVEDGLIIRLRMPFSGTGQRCLINKLIGYSKVVNTLNSLTYVPDLLDATDHLIKGGYTGVYNVVNAGVISAAEIMAIYAEKTDHKYETIDLDGLSHLCGARSNCSLSTEKLLSTGFKMPNVLDRVNECVDQMTYL